MAIYKKITKTKRFTVKSQIGEYLINGQPYHWTKIADEATLFNRKQANRLARQLGGNIYERYYRGNSESDYRDFLQ